MTDYSALARRRELANVEARRLEEQEATMRETPPTEYGRKRCEKCQVPLQGAAARWDRSERRCPSCR